MPSMGKLGARNSLYAYTCVDPLAAVLLLCTLPECRQSDFLATIDLNKTSPTYRKIIHIEPIGEKG